MNASVGWNMHSVVEVAPMKESDAKVAEALDVIRTHATEWLDQPALDVTALASIAAGPKVELSRLRELADRVGFLVMPFAYLDPRSYGDEPDEMKQAIRGFANLSPKLLTYVLCPLEYYSLGRHIDATADLPIYVSPDYIQTFLALDMCLPVFRGIKKDIADLRQKLEMNIRAQHERERIRLRDPMMVAVPKDVGVNGNGLALIGPAWGPDIEEALLPRFKLTAKPKQRKLIEESVGRMLAAKQLPHQSPISEGQKEPINTEIFRAITHRQKAEIIVATKRFLEGDHEVLHGFPLSDAASIARLAIVYYSCVD